MKVKAIKDLFYRGEKYKAGDVFVVTDIYFKTMNKRAVIAADEPEEQPQEAPEAKEEAPEAKEEAPEEQPKKTRRKSKTKVD